MEHRLLRFAAKSGLAAERGPARCRIAMGR